MTRSLVSVDVLPQCVRLEFLLTRIEELAKKTKKESSIREHNQKVIKDAVIYMPPFAESIQNQLSSSFDLLRLQGHRISDQKEQVQQKVDEVLRDPYERPLPSGISPTSISRMISFMIHPDISETTVKNAVSSSDIADALGKAFQAAEEKDSKKAIETLLDISPSILFGKVMELLKSGMSFEQITTLNPEIVPQMEFVLYLDRILTLHNRHDKFLDTRSADTEAEEMKKRDDQHATTYGFSVIQRILTETHTFVSQKYPGRLSGEYDPFTRTLLIMNDIMEMLGSANEFVWQNRVLSNRDGVVEARRLIEECLVAFLPQVVRIVSIYVNTEYDSSNAKKAITDAQDRVFELRRKVEKFTSNLRDLVNTRIKVEFVNPDQNIINSNIYKYENKKY